MDRRGRHAEKRYRNKTDDITYKTISLVMSEPIYKKLEKAVNNETDKNMSRYIEDNVTIKNFKTSYERRDYNKDSLIKKTFTFSEDFVKKIKETGNMSLAVETVLRKKFNL